MDPHSSLTEGQVILCVVPVSGTPCDSHYARHIIYYGIQHSPTSIRIEGNQIQFDQWREPLRAKKPRTLEDPTVCLNYMNPRMVVFKFPLLGQRRLYAAKPREGPPWCDGNARKCAHIELEKRKLGT